MDPIATISSDNFYKFLAILGLILFLTPSLQDKEFFELQKKILLDTKDVEKRIIELNHSYQIIGDAYNKRVTNTEELTNLTNLVTSSADDITKIWEDVKNGKVKEVNNELIKKLKNDYNNVGIVFDPKKNFDQNINDGLKLIQSKLKEYNEKDYEIRLAQIDTDYDIKINKEEINMFMVRYIINSISRGMGLILICIGFMFWYIIYQNPIDKKIFKNSVVKKKGREKRLNYKKNKK